MEIIAVLPQQTERNPEARRQALKLCRTRLRTRSRKPDQHAAGNRSGAARLPEDSWGPMGSYGFWICNKDRQDPPLDEVILKTAESIAPELTRYRQRELDSAQASNEMLQSAVEATSRAKRRSHINNPQ